MKIPENTAVYEITGPMFFGASDKLSQIVSGFGKSCRVLILRMRGVPALDATAYKTIEDIYKKCKETNVTLIISHINEQPLKVLKKQGLFDKMGEEHFAANISEAIEKAEKLNT